MPPGGGAPPGGNPPGGGGMPPDFTAVLQALAQAISAHSKASVDVAEAVKSTTVRVADSINKITLEFKSAVDEAADLKDNLSEVMRVSKKISSGAVFNLKNMKEAKALLGAQLKSFEAINIRGGKTVQQQQLITKAIVGTQRAMKELDKTFISAGRNLDAALDEDTLVTLQKHLRGCVVDADKLSESFKRVQIGPITSGLKTMNQLLGRSGRLEKFTRIGQLGHEVGEAARSYRQGNLSQTKRQALLATLKGKADFLNAPLKADGSLDLRNMGTDQGRTAARSARRMMKKGGFGSLAKDLAGTSGITGVIDSLVGGRILRSTAQGLADKTLKPGIMGNVGMKLMNMGEGSVMRGAGSLMESGMGGVMGVAGKLAIPLAALGAVKDLFDNVAKVNSEVEKGLGGAGIFGGGGTGFRNLQTVRDNLTPGGSDRFYSGLGVTYERQLNVAKGMAESGVNVGELAQQGGGSSIRGIAHTAFVGARLTGLDEMEGTRQIMKLLQQYHETIAGTDKFFDKLAKDTRAAGITTSKYIQIIDEVTSSFDHMARSIDDVTSTLRVLGHSGTQTGEMVKDSMSALLGPQNRGLEQRAFLAQTLTQNPQALAQFASGAQESAMAAGQKALDSLKKAGVDITGISAMSLSTPEGVQRARLRLTRSTEGGAGNVDTQAAGASIEEAFNASMRSDRARRLQGGDYLGFAGGQNILSENAGERMRMQAQSLSILLQNSGLNWKQVMANPGQLQQGQLPVLISKLAESLGTDSKSLLGSIPAYQNAASTMVGQAVNGTGVSRDEYERIAGVARRAGISMKGATAEEQVRSLKTNTQGMEDLAGELAGDEETMGQLITTNSNLQKLLKTFAESTDKAAQEAKARSVAIATRSTSDIFAAAFSNLFNSISKPVTAISEILEKWASSSDWGTPFQPLSDAAKAGNRAAFASSGFQSDRDYLASLQQKLEASDDPNDKQLLSQVTQLLSDSDYWSTTDVRTKAGLDNADAVRTSLHSFVADKKIQDMALNPSSWMGTLNPTPMTAGPSAADPVSVTNITQNGIIAIHSDIQKSPQTNKSGESTPSVNKTADMYWSR
jgi:hypothetical protein